MYRKYKSRKIQDLLQIAKYNNVRYFIIYTNELLYIDKRSSKRLLRAVDKYYKMYVIKEY